MILLCIPSTLVLAGAAGQKTALSGSLHIPPAAIKRYRCGLFFCQSVISLDVCLSFHHRIHTVSYLSSFLLFVGARWDTSFEFRRF